MERNTTSTVVVDLERLRVMNCGVGRFALHLGSALLEANTCDLRFSFLVPPRSSHFLRDQRSNACPVQRWQRSSTLAFLPPRFRRWAGLPEGDLWHVTDQHSRYWPVSSRTPVLLTIHDLNFLREKPAREKLGRIRKLQTLVDRTVGLATISEFSAGEIREHLELRDKPLRVIYNGLSAPRLADARRLVSGPSGPFLFTIGDVTAKKNFHVLFGLLERLPNYQLVIAGRKQSAYAHFLDQEVVRRGLTRRVFLPGEVSDAERQWLYEHCEAFLFPSITEGFGLPVIEAMSFGKPVFITRGTSLPEVGGEVANYWDDFQPDRMLEGFQAGLERVRGDARFAEKSRRHAAQFSWSRAAAEYVAYYHELLGRHGAARRQAA
jgi:glycosyltransferase involved in cell wall biosynthesis